MPGLGLLLEQNPLADRPISLGVRRAFAFSGLVRKPGFAPGPSRSQREVLLLHHNPAGPPSRSRPAKAGALGRTCTDEYEFTKLALLLLKAQGLGE